MTGTYGSGFEDWEQRIVRELYREYNHILHQHREHLRPAAIELFDSETHWGLWNPQTRIIQISRRLVREQPWFHVLGILRHEMAHQWVDEKIRGHVNVVPHRGHDLGDHDRVRERVHGVEFRMACARLGVPSPFAKSTCDLTSTMLDWRTEKRDETTERMLEKVRKLLSLANSSNEHEALLAMNRVREIYAKYNLEQVQDMRQDVKSDEYVHLFLGDGKKQVQIHQRKIIGILVGHFFVQAIFGKMFNADTTEATSVVELIGTRENVLMADYVYNFLLQQTEFHLRETEKKVGRSLGRIGRQSFRLGLLSGFENKLQSAAENRSHERAESANLIVRALVQFEKDPHLKDYMRQVYPNLGTWRSSGHRIDRGVYSDGQIVGSSITLNRPVSGSDGNRGRFLPPAEDDRYS